jgi:hypothetical protein
MSNLKKKQNKKKKRERAAKKRVAARRIAIKAEAKERKMERDIQEIARKASAKAGLSTTFVKKEEDKEGDAKIIKKLENNLEILKALEEEHNKSVESKRQINKTLEDSGAVTPLEKAEAIKAGALENAKTHAKKKNVGGLKGGAEYKVTPSKQ